MQAFICVHQAAPLTLLLLSLVWCCAFAAMWMRVALTMCRRGSGRESARTLLWNCRRGEENGQLDVSDGHLIPWWLLLAGTDRQRPLLDRGVTHVVASGRTLVVTLLDGRRMELCD